MKKVPKRKNRFNRLWVTPDEYYDNPVGEDGARFSKRTGVEWEQKGRYDKIEWNYGDVEYYNATNMITKEEYDVHWKKYYLIKAIKELNV
jgi:hypothetical protein